MTYKQFRRDVLSALWRNAEEFRPQDVASMRRSLHKFADQATACALVDFACILHYEDTGVVDQPMRTRRNG